MNKLCNTSAVLLSATLLGSCILGGGDELNVATTGDDLRVRRHRLAQNDGAEPKGSLTAVTVNGKPVLFGRTAIGGTNGCGTIFSINPDGSNYNVQYRFGGADGCDPRHDAMTLNPNDGKLYATTQGVNQPRATHTYGNQGQIFSFAARDVDSRRRSALRFTRSPARPTARSSTARSRSIP